MKAESSETKFDSTDNQTKHLSAWQKLKNKASGAAESASNAAKTLHEMTPGALASAREKITTASQKTGELTRHATENIKTSNALAATRETIHKLGNKTVEYAGSAAETIKSQFQGERGDALAQLALTIAASEEITLLPFAKGARKAAEGFFGKTVQGEKIGFFKRGGRIVGGAKDIALDMAGGGVINTVRHAGTYKKILKQWRNNPEILNSAIAVLKARPGKENETASLEAVREYIQTNNEELDNQEDDYE